MTVHGLISNADMGTTLTHEHILVDFIGADRFNKTRYDRKKVIDKALPFLIEARNVGIKTLVECTPEYLGRDPVLLKQLSQKSGLNILTNTGFYGAANNKFIPAGMLTKTENELADIWIKEWKSGIGNTAIKPGFIKIGVADDSLSEFHTRLVKAAVITHLKTGLTVVSHTGPYVPAFQQIQSLIESGVSPEAFVWVHANGEEDRSKLVEAARRGAWISLDYLDERNVKDIAEAIGYLKENNCLHRVLLSHDAGWYDPSKPDGGNFRGFTTLSNLLIRLLRSEGLSQAELDLLLVKNPSNAFEIRVRRYNKNSFRKK